MPSDSPSAPERPISTAEAGEDSLDASDAPPPVEWGPVGFDRLRSLALGGVVATGGLVLAVVGVLVVGIAAALLGGARPPSSTWVLVVVLFVGGPVSLLYWLIAYDRTSPERRRELRAQFGDYSFDPSRFRAGWTVAGAGLVLALVGAAVGAGPFLSPASFLRALVPLLISFLAFSPALVGSRGTEVRLDPDALEVERSYLSHDRTRTDDLGAVVRTRRVDLPRLALFLLAYRGNAWYRSTPWLVVPSALADDVEAGLAAALARSDGPDRASTAERVALATLGSFSLVAGGAMAVAAGETTGGLALALLTAPFSLLFVALAVRL